MTRNDAYNLGWEYGYEAGTAALTDTSIATANEVKDKDSFMQTVSEILANQRQYAGHPTYDFSGEKNEDSLYEGFEEGETMGMRAAWRELR
jgi:hypothetical protein